MEGRDAAVFVGGTGFYGFGGWMRIGSLVSRVWRGRVLRWAANLLLAAVILAALLVIVLTHFFDWRFDAVLTGSMSPTYGVGGMVVIRPVEPAAVAVGDVITYEVSREPEQLVTHRVVGMVRQDDSLGFRTKGDGNEAEDSYVVPSQLVVGKVWFYVPLFGHFVKFVKTPLGFVLCLVAPALLLILGEFRRIAARTRSGRGGGKGPQAMEETSWPAP